MVSPVDRLIGWWIVDARRVILPSCEERIGLADFVCVLNIAIECELVRRKQSECYQVKASCYM